MQHSDFMDFFFSSKLKRSFVGGVSEGVQEIVCDLYFWQNIRFMIKLFITPIET